MKKVFDRRRLCDEANLFQTRKSGKTITADDVARIADIIGHTAKLDNNGYMRPSRDIYQEVADKFNERL